MNCDVFYNNSRNELDNLMRLGTNLLTWCTLSKNDSKAFLGVLIHLMLMFLKPWGDFLLALCDHRAKFLSLWRNFLDLIFRDICELILDVLVVNVLRQ